MATISNIGSPSAIRVTAVAPSTEQLPSSDDGRKKADGKPTMSPPNGLGAAPKGQQNSKLQTNPENDDLMQDLIVKLQESLDKVTREQHTVSFRRDSGSDIYVIEIKDRDGAIVRQYPLEKVLNLQRKMDELSGMVIDEMT